MILTERYYLNPKMLSISFIPASWLVAGSGRQGPVPRSRFLLFCRPSRLAASFFSPQAVTPKVRPSLFPSPLLPPHLFRSRLRLA